MRGDLYGLKGIAVRWFFLTVAITISSYLIKGIEVDGFFSAVMAAAILGVLNVFFRPILLILTLPLNILTFGLFTFVINAILLMMASGVIGGFRVNGFWAAVFGSLIISIINWLLSSMINEQGRVQYIDLRKKSDGTRE